MWSMISRVAPRVPILCGLGCAIVGSASPALASVTFGNNVFVGGHNFSHQRYDAKHRAVITLYDRKPPHEGCVWRPDGHGGRVKICHLRQINPR